jgi:hypothetical protein
MTLLDDESSLHHADHYSAFIRRPNQMRNYSKKNIWVLTTVIVQHVRQKLIGAIDVIVD